MRTLTAPFKAKTTSRFGEEPLIVLEVAWGAPTGTRRYGDKAFTLGTLTVEPRIRELSPIRAQLGLNDVGSVASIQVVLLDQEKSLHASLMTAALERKTCRILMGFEGLAESDLLELYVGAVGSPVSWREEDRTLSFQIVSAVESKTIGNLYLKADLALDPLYLASIVGSIPPVVFGATKSVPALKIKAALRGTLGVDVNNATAAFGVIGGSFFPNGQITIRVGNEFMVGSFGNTDTFTPTSRNVPKNNVIFAGRLADEDTNNPHAGYVAAQFTLEPLPGNAIQLVKFGEDIPYAQIVEQRSARIRMDRPAMRLLDDGNGGKTEVAFLIDSTYVGNVRGFNPNERWTIDAGSSITQVGAEGDTYALDASTAVVKVLAKRNSAIYDPHAGSLEILSEVPAAFYSIGSGPKGEVTIRFPKNLSELGQGWIDGEIFVDCTSTLPTHPADVIKYILQTYTDVQVDSASFSAAKSLIGNSVSCSFAQQSPDDALQVARDLAWQVRCVLLILGSKAFLKFLDKAPSTTGNEFRAADTSVREATVSLDSTDLDDVYTVLKASYQERYDLPVIPLQIEKNVSLYGRRVLERPFFGFQDRALVNVGSAFWSRRLSRPWRIVRFMSFNLEPLSVELVDPVLMNLFDILNLGFYAEAREIEHDTAAHTLAFSLWCPIEVGQLAVNSEAYS